MNDPGGWSGLDRLTFNGGDVFIASRAEIEHLARWKSAFADERKDYRFFEIVEDTIHQGFDHNYFIIKDANGEILSIQPFFVLDQDLLAVTNRHVMAAACFIRHLWPRFLRMRTLMVGCAAGEGHLDGTRLTQNISAKTLAVAITPLARKLGAQLIVLKEFPAKYRGALQCFLDHGFTRLPSMPMTKLNIDYANFEDYLKRVLSHKMRANLRQKFKAAARATPPIEVSVVQDIATIVDDVYPLYLNVYERSPLKFEKLTRETLLHLGQRMPDKIRFFIWRQDKRIVAFSYCMVQGEDLYHEYLGFDYSVALTLHLYHLVFRDILEWAIANRYKWYRSGALNYDPKLHLKQILDPIDLYVAHTSPTLNKILHKVLPLLEPTRSEKILRKFPNYKDLWA